MIWRRKERKKNLHLFFSPPPIIFTHIEIEDFPLEHIPIKWLNRNQSPKLINLNLLSLILVLLEILKSQRIVNPLINLRVPVDGLHGILPLLFLVKAIGDKRLGPLGR